MLGLVRFVVIANVIAAVIVVVLEMSTGFFGLKFVSDYAFFIVSLLWGTTALFFMYPPMVVWGSLTTKLVGLQIQWLTVVLRTKSMTSGYQKIQLFVSNCL